MGELCKVYKETTESVRLAAQRSHPGYQESRTERTRGQDQVVAKVQTKDDKDLN